MQSIAARPRFRSPIRCHHHLCGLLGVTVVAGRRDRANASVRQLAWRLGQLLNMLINPPDDFRGTAGIIVNLMAHARDG